MTCSSQLPSRGSLFPSFWVSGGGGGGVPAKGRVKRALYPCQLPAQASESLGRAPGWAGWRWRCVGREPLCRALCFHSLGRLHQDIPFFDISCSEIFESWLFVPTAGADTELSEGLLLDAPGLLGSVSNHRKSMLLHGDPVMWGRERKIESQVQNSP